MRQDFLIHVHNTGSQLFFLAFIIAIEYLQVERQLMGNQLTTGQRG